jgi:hypothetical protein
MLVRLAVSGMLISTLAGMPDDGMLRLAEGTGNSPEVSAQQSCADRHLVIGLYYINKLDLTAAVGRLKQLVTQCPKSSDVEEALAYLTEIYLTLRVSYEAQTAVAVLQRNFPAGKWTIEASNALRSAGFEPMANEKSWITRSFK